jgi:hypothetical protein
LHVCYDGSTRTNVKRRWRKGKRRGSLSISSAALLELLALHLRRDAVEVASAGSGNAAAAVGRALNDAHVFELLEDLAEHAAGGIAVVFGAGAALGGATCGRGVRNSSHCV